MGLLARQFFPNGVEVFNSELSVAEQIKKTRNLIDAGVETIYEAAFNFENAFCRIDILHHGETGWELHEVKASKGSKSE